MGKIGQYNMGNIWEKSVGKIWNRYGKSDKDLEDLGHG